MNTEIGLVAILVAIIAGLFTVIVKVVPERKVFAESRIAEKAKNILRSELNGRRTQSRSFKYLSQCIGGFSDDDIRLMLLDIGAFRLDFRGDEHWCLLSRKLELINRHRARKNRPPYIPVGKFP